MWSVLKRCNPFYWSTRTIKIVTALFIAIAAPVYLFIGLQISDDANSANYPTLEIPSISLNTPVEPLNLQGDQLIAPARIAGSFSNHTNKTLIIGHSSTIFASLDQVAVGDQLIYDGKSYTVQKITTPEKSAINMDTILSAASTPTLILMTCAGEQITSTDYSHRLIITATADP